VNNPNIPPKPQPLAVKPGNIPEALRNRKGREGQEGKWTKPLYQTNGALAESDNPATWAVYEEALTTYLKGGFDGIGFVVTLEDDFAGVDLDHCRDPETGAVRPWAMQIVKQLNSYTEVSPSGEGVRIFLYAKLPPKDRKIGDFECYDSGRYLTITGSHLPETPPTIEHRQEEMTAVYTVVFAERNQPRGNGTIPPPAGLPNLSDRDVLDLAFNARNGETTWRLYHGDRSGYGSPSEADLGLCSRLAFYTGPDPEKIDRLYRSSDLYRPKWDDPRGDSTWGAQTITRALEGRSEFYHAYDNGPTFFDDSEPEAPWPDRMKVKERPEAPPLPERLVPEALRPWLKEISSRACLPLEMVAIPAIIAAGAVIGRQVGLQPASYDNFYLVPNLWGGVVARPGAMKTHAISEAIKPLKRLAAAAREKYQNDLEDKASHVVRLKAEIEAIKSEMVSVAKGKGKEDSKTLDQLETDLTEKQRALKEDTVTARRYMTQDATIEVLGELLRDNPRGLLVHRDELTGWLQAMGRAGREADRPFYLESWNGTEPFVSDRIARGTTDTPATCISICGGIQPGRFRTYVNDALAGGDGDDGLLQRLQMVVWIEELGKWAQPAGYPDSAVYNHAFEVFKWLDGLSGHIEAGLLGVTRLENNVPITRFDSEAQQLFDQWRSRLEDRARGEAIEDMPGFEAHIAKYRSLMPSLALIFYLINLAGAVVPGTLSTLSTSIVEVLKEKYFRVNLEATRLAAAWCDYLEYHAGKIYAAEVCPGMEAAYLLSKKIESGEVVDGDNVSDISHRHHWQGLDTPPVVKLALNSLETAGWVRVVKLTTKGRPTEIVRVHPDFRVKGGNHDGV
jgi:hypothetical protein